MNCYTDWKIIKISGEIDSELDFTYGPYEWDQPSRGEGVRTVDSCSATLNGEMYVFGGQFVNRQVNLTPIELPYSTVAYDIETTRVLAFRKMKL